MESLPLIQQINEMNAEINTLNTKIDTLDTKVEQLKNSSTTNVFSSAPMRNVESNPYYFEDIRWLKKTEILYMQTVAPLPDISTKYIVCDEQVIPLYSMLGDFVVSYLTEPVSAITHDCSANQTFQLPQLKIIPFTSSYYFTINVTAISNVAPTLQLCNHNATNTPVSFSGLKSATGIQKISCTVGAGAYTEDSILAPYIGITADDIANQRYISYEILGVYNRNDLDLNENFIGDIKFSGERFDGSNEGIIMTVNNVNYTLPVMRSLFGFSDYIRNGKLYRKIVKKRITADMIDTLSNQWSVIYKYGKKSSMVMLNLEITDFVQSSDPWYVNNGLRYYIWSPTLTTHPMSSLNNFGGDANIRCIFYGNAYSYEGQRIILKLKNSDIGYNYETDSAPTAEYLASKYKEWVTTHPTYIYYPVETPIEENLNITLPVLKGNGFINTVKFDTGSTLSIAPTLKVKRPDSKYRNLTGKIWLCIGDSITQAQGSNFSYSVLAKNLIPNCITYNYGSGGSSICNYNNGSRAWGIWAKTNINTFPEYADLITIMLGVNDRKTTLNIGSPEDLPDENGSYYAAYKQLILTLTNKYPLARLVICAPPRLSYYADEEEQLYDIYHVTKQIAEYFNLEFLDVNKGGGVNNLSPPIDWQITGVNKRNGWLTPDGLHYNDLAQQMLFEYLVAHL
ncbi:SGNH/GDSL hydrolase family protein [Cellulosilyticum ruminicola]|uniref:SGNH/GDSL hydrolase family protein n=1 Tax=Cellulosilyticum ruminicola TaxID=425254 RepID=UPI0006D05579|nr:GDSL-type esterase/lipase family protein [Cellulosilyticum ruminicola]